jgi:hypothetical protein
MLRDYPGISLHTFHPFGTKHWEWLSNPPSLKLREGQKKTRHTFAPRSDFPYIIS